MGNSCSSATATAPAKITVFVTYVATHLDRHVTLRKGSTKTALVEEFLKCFKDVVTPDEFIKCLKFMWFDGTAFVELPENHVLQDNDIIKAELQSCDDPPVVPHPIEDDEEYYLWSFVSQENDDILKKGLQPDPSKNIYDVKCDGLFTSDNSSVHFKARVVTVSGGPPLFMFTLPSTPKKVLALKGQEEGMVVILEEIDESDVKPSPTHKEFKFEYLQSFSYTQFKCLDVGGRNDLYITSAKEGAVTLTKGGQPGYPKPSTLFIAISKI